MAYVYLLRDPRIRNPAASIFYVGKATGRRPTAHLFEAERLVAKALEELESGQASASDGRSRSAMGRKIDRIHAITAAGKQVAIEVIAGKDHRALSGPEALKIEAGIIAALRMTELGNRVAGSGVRSVQHSVFLQASRAKPVALPRGRKAVVVPVKGVWGGANYSGSMIGVPDSVVWQNARRLWTPFADGIVEDIAKRARGPEPALLIAIDSHPLPGRANIIVGLWQLQAARATGDVKGSRGPKNAKVPYFGWELLRASSDRERPETVKARQAMLGHELLGTDGQPMAKPQGRSYLPRGYW